MVLPFAIVLAFPFYWSGDHGASRRRPSCTALDRGPFGGTTADTRRTSSDLFAEHALRDWLVNTALVGVIVVAITLSVAMPAGYALARLSGRLGADDGVGIFLRYLVPPTLLFLPLSRVISDLRLQDRLLGR